MRSLLLTLIGCFSLVGCNNPINEAPNVSSLCDIGAYPQALVAMKHASGPDQSRFYPCNVHALIDSGLKGDKSSFDAALTIVAKAEESDDTNVVEDKHLYVAWITYLRSLQETLRLGHSASTCAAESRAESLLQIAFVIPERPLQDRARWFSLISLSECDSPRMRALYLASLAETNTAGAIKQFKSWNDKTVSLELCNLLSLDPNRGRYSGSAATGIARMAQAHVISCRLAPNNSFKPKPLRGPA